MKSLLTILASSLLCMACGQDLTGSLQVQRSFNIRGENNRDYNFESGKVYKARVRLKSQRSAQMRIVQRGARVAVVDLPFSKRIDDFKDGDRIQVRGNEINQNFDLNGLISIDHTQSGPYWRTESCELYRRDEWRCHRYKEDGEWKEHCAWEEVIVYGEEDVQYYTHRVDRDLNIDINRRGSNTLLGKFSGDYDSSWDEVVSRSRCR